MIKIKPTFFLLFSFIFFEIISSCQTKIENKSYSKNENHKTLNEKINNKEIEIFDVNKMLFNGKSKRFFSINEFEKNFGKIDSTKLMIEEEPCSYIFENSDGSKDTDDRYLYKNGSRFENNKEQVAIDEFRFNNGNFIKYDNLILNSSTTIKDLSKIFPNAVNEIETLDVYGEEKLQVIELRQDHNHNSDGHIKIFLKNGKLYFMHWWYPC